MSDDHVAIYNLQYRRLFPWLHLIRAFRIAADVRKLVLAGLALMLVSIGSLVCDQLPWAGAESAESIEAREAARWPWQKNLGYDLWHGGSGAAELRGLLHDPRNTLLRIAGNWQIVLLPYRDIVEQAAVLFRGDASSSSLADAASRLLWNLLVWSIFGGAICRIAAIQFARDQQIGLRRAIAFSASRLIGYFSAPLMPLVGVALLWALCILGGWIGRIPGGVGPTALGALWGLELLFGFLMVVVLVGLAFGWPLMFATISVEGTDGFDGLSRAYNYIFERPLYVLWQSVVTMVYGSLAIFFVWLGSQLLTELAVWGVSWGLGFEATQGFVSDAPTLTQDVGFPSPQPASLGNGIARGWMCALAVFVVGFIYSFFWSSATIAYFVLRHSVDANDFDEVYVEEAEEHDELLPLVGTAAMGEAGTQASGPPVKGGAEPSLSPVDLTP